MSKDVLTEKQKRFIDFYIETGNATEAARKAGYKGKNLNRIGSENLSKLDFIIKDKISQKDKERIASSDEVLRFFTSVMRGRVREEIPIMIGKGKQAIAKKGTSIRDRIEAAKQLSKRFGLDSAEVGTDGSGDDELSIAIMELADGHSTD